MIIEGDNGKPVRVHRNLAGLVCGHCKGPVSECGGRSYTCTYHCERCGETWEETWCCACDSECPRCHADISPSLTIGPASAPVMEGERTLDKFTNEELDSIASAMEAKAESVRDGFYGEEPDDAAWANDLEEGAKKVRARDWSMISQSEWEELESCGDEELAALLKDIVRGQGVTPPLPVPLASVPVPVRQLSDLTDKQLADMIREGCYAKGTQFSPTDSRWLLVLAVPYGEVDSVTTVRGAFESFRALMADDDWMERHIQVLDAEDGSVQELSYEVLPEDPADGGFDGNEGVEMEGFDDLD